MIWEYQDKNVYKYTSGMTQNFAEASKHQATVRKAGFKDAFIVAFNNDQRITIDEAKRLLGK